MDLFMTVLGSVALVLMGVIVIVVGAAVLYVGVILLLTILMYMLCGIHAVMYMVYNFLNNITGQNGWRG